MTEPEKASPKKPHSSFRKAMVITAIPFVAFSIAWMIGGRALTSLPLNVLVGIPLLGIPAAVILAVILAVARRQQAAAGVLAGLGIGIITMGVSCFSSSLALTR